MGSSWVKRTMIENVMERVCHLWVGDGQKPDLWSAEQHENEKPSKIDSVTQPPLFECFVFVMSIPESLFRLELLCVTGMQHEEGSSSADRCFAPICRPRRAAVPRGDEASSCCVVTKLELAMPNHFVT